MSQKIAFYCEWCHLDDTFCKCHRSANRSRRVSDDDKLRAAGFTIKDRPKDGRNVWERRGLKYDELVALEIIEQEVGRD